MWRGNHASPVVRLQRLCMLPLCLLKPCHHHMNKPRPTCWRMRQYEEEMPDIPAENIWGQSIFSQSFKMWEGLEPQSYSAANHRCMSTMEARQRKHPHYLKMHDWEGMLTVSNPWILGDISTVFPDSNLICLILATRIISSKHKLDHNILLNIQQWFRFQSPYRARVLKKGFSWPGLTTAYLSASLYDYLLTYFSGITLNSSEFAHSLSYVHLLFLLPRMLFC